MSLMHFAIDDRSAGGHSHLSGMWPYGYAARFRRAGADGSRGSGTGPVFWSVVPLPRKTRLSHQAFVVGYAGPMSFFQAYGERPFRLADGGNGSRFLDGGTAIHV